LCSDFDFGWSERNVKFDIGYFGCIVISGSGSGCYSFGFWSTDFHIDFCYFCYFGSLGIGCGCHFGCIWMILADIVVACNCHNLDHTGFCC